MSKASNLFTAGQKESIAAAVRSAEQGTSAEIRVHIENRCKDDVMDRAVDVFSKLGMNRTAQRNGILIYLAVKDHKAAIIGDVNVNRYVSHDFWLECYAAMKRHFADEDFSGGLCAAIAMIEKELASHFPHRSDDVNELPDDISFG